MRRERAGADVAGPPVADPVRRRERRRPAVGAPPEHAVAEAHAGRAVLLDLDARSRRRSGRCRAGRAPAPSARRRRTGRRPGRRVAGSTRAAAAAGSRRAGAVVVRLRLGHRPAGEPRPEQRGRRRAAPSSSRSTVAERRQRRAAVVGEHDVAARDARLARRGRVRRRRANGSASSARQRTSTTSTGSSGAGVAPRHGVGGEPDDVAVRRVGVLRAARVRIADLLEDQHVAGVESRARRRADERRRGGAGGRQHESSPQV